MSFNFKSSYLLRVQTLVLVCLFLSACGAYTFRENLPRTVDQQKSSQSDLFWNRIKFKLHWPDNTSPDFSTHTLIADQVLRPILYKHESSISLWWFHRRAARTPAGHQFSFIFYSSQQIAIRIFNSIQSSELVSALIENNIVERITPSYGNEAGEISIHATSDPQWPLEIQKSWPYFIMGVSQSWLDLIDQLKAEMRNPRQDNIIDLLEYYRLLNQALSIQWTRYGRHAYFHHINALFGYEPLYIFETEDFRNF